MVCFKQETQTDTLYHFMLDLEETASQLENSLEILKLPLIVEVDAELTEIFKVKSKAQFPKSQ